MAKYRVGDKVKIVDKWVDAFVVNWDGLMDKWLGKTMTIRNVDSNDGGYYMVEDKDENFGTGWFWDENNIECRVDDTPTPRFEIGDKVKIIGNGGKVTLADEYSEDVVHNFKIGTIATIVKGNFGHSCYYCVDDTDLYQYVSPCDLALVTDSNDTPKDDCYFEFDGFKYGDKVKVTVDLYNAVGLIGTIIAYDTLWGMVGVEFDTPMPFPANNCSDRTHGRIGKDKHCLWFMRDSLNIISTTPTNTIEYYNGKVVCVKSDFNGYTVGKIYQIKDGQITDNFGDKYPTIAPPVKSFKEWCDWTTSKFIEIVE